MASKKDSPLITFRLVLFLAVVGLGSGLFAYWYKKKPVVKTGTEKNPNVLPFDGVKLPKKSYKPFRPSKELRYTERHVFPTIKKHQKEIKKCYFGYKGKEKRPAKGGIINVEMVIKKDGTIDAKKLRIFRSEIKIKEIQQCVMKRVSTWKFAPHTKKKPVRLQFPFFLR